MNSFPDAVLSAKRRRRDIFIASSATIPPSSVRSGMSNRQRHVAPTELEVLPLGVCYRHVAPLALPPPAGETAAGRTGKMPVLRR